MQFIVEGFNAAMIRSPGISEWWSKANFIWDPEFRDYVEATAEAQRGDPHVFESLSWYALDDESKERAS